MFIFVLIFGIIYNFVATLFFPCITTLLLKYNLYWAPVNWTSHPDANYFRTEMSEKHYFLVQCMQYRLG